MKLYYYMIAVLVAAIYNISLCLRGNFTLIHNISLAFNTYKKFMSIYNITLYLQ